MKTCVIPYIHVYICYWLFSHTQMQLQKQAPQLGIVTEYDNGLLVIMYTCCYCWELHLPSRLLYMVYKGLVKIHSSGYMLIKIVLLGMAEDISVVFAPVMILENGTCSVMVLSSPFESGLGSICCLTDEIVLLELLHKL